MSFNDIISSRYKTNVKVMVGEPLYQAPRSRLQVLLKKIVLERYEEIYT